VGIRVGVGWLVATIYWDAGGDTAAEFLSDDALGTDEDCARLKVGGVDDAKGLIVTAWPVYT
jgi:hypothetical protein